MERSTLAWFRHADPEASQPLDDTAQLIVALRERHRVDVFTAATAHNFVWQHFREPYNLCVYEMRDENRHRSMHEFIAPYLVHYPGVAVLRGRPRGARRLLNAATMVVTPHRSLVDDLQDELPDLPVRYAPPGVAANAAPSDDIILALDWPPSGDAHTGAFAAMAAGHAVVVFETSETADWPALNPQTWQPRGPNRDAPIVVSIDPRDHEHSLRLAMRRLESDGELREKLGRAAREWWSTHATVAHAVDAWERIIGESRQLAPRPHRIGGQPPEDGTERARAILTEFGVSVDLF